VEEGPVTSLRGLALVLAVSGIAAMAACGPDRRTRKPGTDDGDAAVARQYPDLAALYGGPHGIYRTCSPNDGVCHNNQEYPDLSTLGRVQMTIGARCNRGRSRRDVHDLCESMGDFVVAGERRTELAGLLAIRGPGESASDDEPDILDTHDFWWMTELAVRTKDPLSVEPGRLVAVVRNEGARETMIGRFKVVPPRPQHPRGKNVLVLSRDDSQNADWQYGSRRRFTVGDANGNGVFGHQLGGGLVVPGAPERSYLLRRLVDPAAGPLMPRANCCTWTKASLRALHCWIAGLDPDGSNALEPIDYSSCPPGPEEDVEYPAPGPNCSTSGMCPVTPRVDATKEATWAVVFGLLSSRCGGPACHGTGANGLDVANEARARKSLETYVVPGDPIRSDLYRRVTPELARDWGVEPMPKGAPALTLRERELIRSWIAASVDR
jgi:hypothetical protein